MHCGSWGTVGAGGDCKAQKHGRVGKGPFAAAWRVEPLFAACGGSASVPECRSASAVVVGAVRAVLHFLRAVLCTVVWWARRVSVGTNAPSRTMCSAVQPPTCGERAASIAFCPMAFQGQSILGLGVRHTCFGFQRWCTRGSWPFVVAGGCRRCAPVLLQETMDLF